MMRNMLTKRVLERFLKKAPELEDTIKSVKMELRPNKKPPFEMLVHSIVYQQLSGKAAKSILNRLLELVGELTPESLLSKKEEELKGVGLSRQKASYVRNVAQAFGTGGPLQEFTAADSLRDLTSDQITELFVDIKGVGEWTAQMYLIFSLGRLDVLSPKDLGVRKGFMKMYNLKEMPTPKEVEAIAESWHPLETVGTVLAWRVLEGD
ncbi:DNA-3-methyladenine glycosylase 2 family protein [Candidatus Thorarchaeota archaeon]|nr:MAG: DNA-3-methyladenine glycosylase 2 family protein [Candidatus Thorarchaeota archaeon]